MPHAADAAKIDQLMEQASAALAAMRYFEAERLALQALLVAREQDDFDRMARIVLPLMEARRQRFQMALDFNVIMRLDAFDVEQDEVEPGCYLLEPPAVGADARRLRLAALEREIPVAVLCVEPITQLRLVPVVAIGASGSLRAKIDPPADIDALDLAWIVHGLDELGNSAISEMDPEQEITRRVDALLDRLDNLPEHEGLHHALIEACHEAKRALAEDAATGRGRKSRSRRRVKT